MKLVGHLNCDGPGDVIGQIIPTFETLKKLPELLPTLLITLRATFEILTQPTCIKHVMLSHRRTALEIPWPFPGQTGYRRGVWEL